MLKMLRTLRRCRVWIVVVPLFLISFLETFGRAATMEVLAGHFFSPVIGATHRQDLNYMAVAARYEVSRPFRYLPLFLEATYNHTTKGPDGYMAGLTIIGRYQFSTMQSITPYFQIGAGMLYNNIYKDHSQDLIGKSIEFNPQLGLGFKHALNSSCAFQFELGFQHISNAGLNKDRNIGVNGVGGLIGLSWSLR